VLRVKHFLLLPFALVLVLSLSAFAKAPAGTGHGIRTIPLNGAWSFLPDPSGSLKAQDLASAKDTRWLEVPGSWQSQFADLRDYAGVAWYWRTVQVEVPKPGQVALLRFGAVDYRAEVYVNGKRAGSHDGGYLPFEFDVTSLLQPGDNQVAVRVVDPGLKPRQVEGIRYAEIPHGKQD
jgi:beta-galactosidase/beta-glucuronidase